MSTDLDVPLSLFALQKWMGSLVGRRIKKIGAYQIPSYGPQHEQEIKAKITQGPILSASERMGLYNQQYWYRLFRKMEEQYPFLLRLFGRKSFKEELAEPYLIKYPSSHWSLAALGKNLPRWISKEYKGKDKTLIYQAAILDEAYHSLPFERDAGKLKQKDLTAIEKKPLTLQKRVRLFSFPVDLPSFRSALLEHEASYWEKNEFPDHFLKKESTFFVLFFEEKSLFYEKISAEEFFLLKRFEKGARLEEALEGFCQESGKWVGGWFQKWAKRGWLF